jgi:hypothetical protein
VEDLPLRESWSRDDGEVGGGGAGNRFPIGGPPHACLDGGEFVIITSYSPALYICRPTRSTIYIHIPASPGRGGEGGFKIAAYSNGKSIFSRGSYL